MTFFDFAVHDLFDGVMGLRDYGVIVLRGYGVKALHILGLIWLWSYRVICILNLMIFPSVF